MPGEKIVIITTIDLPNYYIFNCTEGLVECVDKIGKYILILLGNDNNVPNIELKLNGDT